MEGLLASLSLGSSPATTTTTTTTTPSAGENFCQKCRLLDAAVTLHEIYLQTQTRSGSSNNLDVHLGRKSDLLARSSECVLCDSLASYAEDVAASLPDYLKPKYATDYDFSAHFMDKAPHLWIAFGSSPAAPGNASERRRYLTQMSIIWLFSSTTAPNVGISGSWPAGGPRMFDPERLDPSLIRNWLRRCKHSHGDRCQQAQAWLLRSSIRPSFVDVGDECIITPEADVSYAALSYVWGPVETLQATRANIDELKRPGSLSVRSVHVAPRTIRDAMTLCRLVGQKYLWVDRVCIVQDDFETKGEHLKAMAELYAKAEFTIVAANGPHADYGLSGLGQDVDERRKHLIRFPSRTMIKGTMWIAGTNRFSQTVWSTRAWTFQEHVFSRRLLFMDKFVNWACFSARWAEAWAHPSEMEEETTGLDQDGSPSDKLFVVNWPSVTEFSIMVEQYNQRRLRYDSDILNAFAGVLTQMCEGFPAGFYGGTPEFYFDICLLWQPRNGLRPRFRQEQEEDAAAATTTTTTTTTHVPSWSWLGWSGRLKLDMWTFNTDTELPPSLYDVTISPLVQWFKDPQRSSQSRVDNSYFTVRNHFTVSGAPPPDGWRKHDGDGDSGHVDYYTYNAHPHIDSKRKFRYPVPPFQRYRDISLDAANRSSFLYFTTQRAFFHFGAVSPDEPKRWGYHESGRCYAVDLPLLLGPADADSSTPSSPSSWAGSIRITAPESADLPTGQRCELIRIARGSVAVRASSSSDHATLEEDRIRRAGQSRKGIQLGHPFPECEQKREAQLAGEDYYRFYFVLWIEWADDNDGGGGGVARRKALGRVWDRAWDRAGAEEVDVVLG